MSLKHAILGFLSFKSFSGYDLKKAFDSSVHHFWPANQSQIYRTLAELDDQGLVEKEIIPREERLDMKIYRITQSGQAELHRWLSTPLSELGDREPFLIQVYFGGQLSDAEAIHLLEHYMEEAGQRMMIYTKIYEAVYSQSPSFPDPRALYFSMLTLEYGLATSRAALDWAQNAVARIRAGDYSPAGLSAYLGEK